MGECLTFHESYASSSQAVNEVFSRYDVDYSGYLEESEVRRIFFDNYGVVNEMEVQLFIERGDSNRDGRLSWDEVYYLD